MSVPIPKRSAIISQENLVGTQGAQTIIYQLNSSRSVVTKLQLNHNLLGDDGVSTLFAFLKSPSQSASRHRISEIHLNSNGISCRGLRDIVDYIVGNEALKILGLANNKIGPDHDVLASFATQINQSRLEFLSLSGNQLGDAGFETLLCHLRAPRLQELHISTMGLTARCASGLAEWISKRRSWHTSSGGARSLHTLKCNGNNLGIDGVYEVIHAIRAGNRSLVKVELYANQIAHTEIPNHNSLFQQTTQLPSSETQVSWKDAERDLRVVLLQNAHLKRQIEKEALSLLKYSRALIFRSRAPLLSADQHISSHSASESFQFHSLPMELRLQILAVLAPSLSSAQRARIYEYAADASTLPPLLSLPQRGIGHGCVADPSQFLGASVGFALHNSGGCAEGKCMGTGNSLVCRREAERAKFLAAVECCAYEPECDRNNAEGS